MFILSEQEQAALKDGVDALRYRAEALRNHSQYEDTKPWSEMTAKRFELHADLLEKISKKEM